MFVRTWAGPAGNASITRRVTPGASSDSPAATTRIAETSSSAGARDGGLPGAVVLERNVLEVRATHNLYGEAESNVTIPVGAGFAGFFRTEPNCFAVGAADLSELPMSSCSTTEVSAHITLVDALIAVDRPRCIGEYGCVGRLALAERPAGASGFGAQDGRHQACKGRLTVAREHEDAPPALPADGIAPAELLKAAATGSSSSFIRSRSR